MSVDTHALSDSLREMADTIQASCKSGQTVSQNDFEHIITFLRSAGSLASLMEQELAVFRLREAHKDRRKTMETLATETLSKALVSQEGNVLHPDFGRKT